MRRLPLLLSAGLLLAACGSGADPDTAEPAATADAPADDAGSSVPAAPAAPPADEVPAALQFSAPLIGGDDIELTTLAGRPVLLWFWAPW